jgi:hypothetical protein
MPYVYHVRRMFRISREQFFQDFTAALYSPVPAA